MVAMDIPKLQPDRTVQWVRVTVKAGLVAVSYTHLGLWD